MPVLEGIRHTSTSWLERAPHAAICVLILRMPVAEASARYSRMRPVMEGIRAACYYICVLILRMPVAEASVRVFEAIVLLRQETDAWCEQLHVRRDNTELRALCVCVCVLCVCVCVCV